MKKFLPLFLSPLSNVKGLLAFLLVCAFSLQLKAQVTVTSSGGTPIQFYTSLKLAFDAINFGTHTGTINIAIISNTNETVSAVLDSSGNGFSNYNSITIAPTGGIWEITGSIVGPLIHLNGADSVTINGINSGGTGLILNNSGFAQSSAITFSNDATKNQIRNCVLKNSNSNGLSGTVFFSTATQYGNDSNLIANCLFDSSTSGLATYHIYGVGTAGKENSFIQITNNYFTNYFSSNLASGGILASSNNTNWHITNNRFYQGAVRTFVSGVVHRVISINSGSEYNVSGNIIGGQDSTNSGVYSLIGAFTHSFIGISLVSNSTLINVISNNIIKGIEQNSTNTLSTGAGVFCAILLPSGSVSTSNIDIIGNQIGDTTGTGSINVISGSLGTVMGISSASVGNVGIYNNQIGSMQITSTTTLGSYLYAINIFGIAQNLIIRNNIIGNNTPNNLSAGTLGITTGNNFVLGIGQPSASNNIWFRNNIIRNLTSYSTSTASYARGYFTSGSTNSLSSAYVDSNTIYSIKAYGALVGITSGYTTVTGIQYLSSLLGGTISNNIIYDLECANSGLVSTHTAGITIGSTTNILIERNKIYNLRNLSTQTSTTAPGVIAGIGIRSGTTSVRIRNNFIALGQGVTNNVAIIGVYANHGSSPNPNDSLLYNTVFITGSGNGNQPSFCFFRGDFTTTARTMNVGLFGNQFINRRTNTNTGKNFTISNNYGATTPSATGWPSTASNNNNLVASDSTNVCSWGTTGHSLTSWQANNYSDLNSVSKAVTFADTTIADLHLTGASRTDTLFNVTTYPTVLTDFDGQFRSLPQTKIGADEHFDQCSGMPTAGSVSGPANACPNIPFNLSLNGSTSAVGLTYQWQISNTGLAGSYTNIPNSNSVNFNTNQNDTNWYKCIVSCGLLSDTTQAFVVNTNGVPVPANITVDTTLAISSTNYHSLPAAIADLACRGIIAPVTVTVAPHGYVINGQLNIGTIPGASATNTITINGNGTTIQTTATPVVTFNSSKFFTLDSFNVVGLSIVSPLTPFAGYGIWIYNGARNITIKNSTIDVGITSASSTNCAIAVSNSNTSPTTAGNNAQYVQILNNTIKGGYYGITLIGNSSYLDNYGHEIKNNTIRDYYLAGIYTINTDTSLIEGNDIHKIGRPAATTTYGIYISTGRNIKAKGNRIHDFGSSSSVYYPVYITTSVNTVGFETEFSNNLIYNLPTTSTIYGVYALSTLNNLNFYHNTIAIDAVTGGTNTIRAFWFSAAPNGCKLRNNIINITGNNTGTKHGIYVTTVPTGFSSNYNTIRLASTSNNFTGFWNGLNRVSLADWTAASLQDSNSNVIDPDFANPAMGLFNPLSIPLDNLGTPVASVTTDINGNTRSLTTPDIGAYEFTTAILCNGAPYAGNAIATKTLMCVGDSSLLDIANDTATIGLTYQWYESTTGPNGTYAPVAGGANKSFYRQQTQSTWYKCLVDCSGSGSYSTPVLIKTLTGALSGNYRVNKNYVDSANFFISLTEVAQALSCLGVSGAVTIDVDANSGPYTGGVTFGDALNPIVGLSPTNPITINAHNNLFSGIVSPSIQLVQVTDFTLDSFNISTTGMGILMRNNCARINITNSKIDVGVNSTSGACIAASNSTTSPTTAGTNASFVNISNNELIGGLYGISLFGSGTYMGCYGNQIKNNLIRDFYNMGVYLSSNDSCLVEKNEFKRLVRTLFTSTYAVYFTSSRQVTVSKNRIHHFGSGSYLSYPIYVATSLNLAGFPSNISNNIIYDIENTGTFYGIYLTGAVSDMNVYHNTISTEIPALSTGAIRGFFNGSTGNTNINFKNNIINIYGGGSGIKYGIYVTNTSPTFITNNNLVRMTTTGTTHFGYWTADRTTLASWQTASNQDLNSETTDPLLVNQATGNLEPTSPFVDNLGAVTSITTDIEDSTRSVSTPDIGAYEFKTAPDCSGTPEAGMAVANKTYVCSSDSVSLSLANDSISNGLNYMWLASTTGANGVYSPVDSFKNIYRTQTQTHWYKCVVACLNNKDTSDVVMVRTTTTPFNGNYTINKNAPDSANNYSSFTRLITEMNCTGVTGPVTVDVVAGSGPYNEELRFGKIPGISSTNLLTINGNGNTIKGSATPIVWFRSAQYITLDSLNITGDSLFAGYGVYFSDTAQYITLNRNTINVNMVSTLAANCGIVASGSPTSPTTAGTNAQYLTITNNTVIGGYYSLALMGVASYLNNYGHYIANNNFIDQYYMGSYIGNADSMIYENNNIQRVNRANINTIFYGSYFVTCRNIKYRKNRIHDIGAPTSTVYGILFTTSANGIGYETEIVNNAVYNMGGTSTFYGIYGASVTGLNIYHNTVDRVYNAPNTSTQYLMYFVTTSNNVNIKNNILRLTGNSTATKYGIYQNVASPTAFVSDNNVFHLSGGTNNNVGYWAAANRVTLANWQAASGQDNNSNTFDPLFANIASGDLTPASPNTDNMGTNVGVTNDIYGNARSVTTPDVGAVEYTGIAGDLALNTPQIIRAGQCYGSNDTVRVTLTNTLGSLVDFAVNPINITWNVTGPVNSTGVITVNSGTLAVGNSASFWSNTATLTLPGTYSISAYLSTNAINVIANNDSVVVLNEEYVRPILVVAKDTFTVASNADSLTFIANSPFFDLSVNITEICHWRASTTGAPAGGWPSYLIADDYLELTGVPGFDLDGYTLEEWNAAGTNVFNTTFAPNTIFSPNGTLILAHGQLGASVPSPTNFYYHTGNTASHGSTVAMGYILKNKQGVIVDAVVYGNMTFPVAAGVASTDWSGITPSLSSAGNRMIATDNNTSSVWVSSNATDQQNPNTLNTGLSVPSVPNYAGFSWLYNGNSIGNSPVLKYGTWNLPGLYTYVAQYSNACGTFYDTIFVTATSTVPVKLLGLKAAANGNNVAVSWKTASEINSHYFEVYASADGINFTPITKVKAAGNSQNIRNYSFLHQDILAKQQVVYYKLKMVDVDGKFEWSNVVNVNSKNNNSITLYPNPFKQGFVLQMPNTNAVTVEIYDLTGQLVFNTQVEQHNGVIELNQLTNLKQGMYLVKTNQNGAVNTFKVVKE